MAIKINPHLSRVGARGYSGASPTRASADSFGAQSAAALDELGRTTTATGKVFAREAEKVLLERGATRVIEKENELRDRYREFDTDYRSRNQGKNALSAADDYGAFLDDEIAGMRQGIGDRRVLEDFDRRMGAFRSSALNHAASYQLAQEERWKKDTLDAQGITVFSLAANPDVPDSEKFAAFEDYQRNTMALYPGVKEAQTAANGERFKKETGRAQLAKLERQIRTNPGEAITAIDAALGKKTGMRVPVDANEPRGIRNNNPGNIRINARNAWQGAVDGEDGEFVTFATPEHGVRAMGRVLINYEKDGVNTVAAIVSRWAPPSENNTGAYVKRVAESLGVSADTPLNISDPETLGKLTKALITHENGKNPYSDEVIRSGVMAALGQGGLESESADIAANIPEDQLAALRTLARKEYVNKGIETVTATVSGMEPVAAVDWIVANVSDPEIQGSAIAVQQKRQSQDAWQKRENLNARLEEAYDKIRSSTTPAEAQVIIDSFPPEERGKLDTVARRHFSGDLTITDKAKMGEFLTRLANGDSSINLKAEYGAYFSDTDMASAEKKLKDAEKRTRAVSASQLFDQYAVQSGMKKMDDRKRAKAFFVERVDMENATTPKEQKRILFDMFREVNYVDGGWFWFDKTMPAWKAREKAVKDGVNEEDMTARLVPVPAAKATIRANVRAEIVRHLRADGRPITEDNVRRVFERYREEMGWM